MPSLSPPVIDPPQGRRDRKKTETRLALADAAIRLFDANGFDATTIDDIADAVDVSTRTFHRYFERKEDVVFGDQPERLARLIELLDGRPVDEPPLRSVRFALVEMARDWHRGGDVEAMRARLVASTPALRAASLARYDIWAATIAGFIARRSGGRRDDPWPSVAARCMTAAVIDARRRWAREGGDIARRVQSSLDLLTRLSAELAEAPR